jgi:hypothetical protein
LNKPLSQYLTEEWHQIAQDFNQKGLIRFVTHSLPDGRKVRRRIQLRFADDNHQSEPRSADDAQPVEEDDQRPLRTDSATNNAADDRDDVSGGEPQSAAVAALIDAIREALLSHPDAEIRDPEILASICMRLIEKRYSRVEPRDLLPRGELPSISDAYGHGVLTEVGREFFKGHSNPAVRIRRVIDLLNEALPVVQQQFNDEQRPTKEER